MEKFIIANWKSYINLEKAISILDNVKNTPSLIIAPAISHTSYLSKKYTDIVFAAQDISSLSSDLGAYTGENISDHMIDLGIKHTLIGHSERRLNNLDNNESVAKKLSYSLAKDMNPILCIGEDLEQRKSGQYKEVIEAEIDYLLPVINENLKDGQKLIIAYEPFWAIGTGLTPSIDEIQEIATIIKSKVNLLDKSIFLVYGGSVNNDNAQDILGIQGIDGLLIGGASTDENKLNSIIDLV